MQPETYRMLANRQEHYWWHRARRKMAISLLRRYGAPSGGTWVELGCGPGGNLSISQKFQPRLSLGVDLSPLALELAREKKGNVNLVQADLNLTLPLSSESTDVITIFNVLYHQWVKDESSILCEVKRLLRPRGLLLLTEPAFQILRRDMDEAAMTRTRYRRADFVALCRKAGLEVLFSSYFTSFGFPVLAGFKAAQACLRQNARAKRHSTAPDMRSLNSGVNELMYRIAAIEAALIAHGVPMPVGTTLLCLARNTSDQSMQLSSRAI